MVFTSFFLGWAVLPVLHYAPTAGAGPGAAGASAPSDRPASEVGVQTDEEVPPLGLAHSIVLEVYYSTRSSILFRKIYPFSLIQLIQMRVKQ